MRLECRSGGGKPAPRIEWLNLTERESGVGVGMGRHELQLMRSMWPIKRAHFVEQQVPVSSSSLTLTLSRADLHSSFVCLVLAPALQPAGAANELLPANLDEPSHLARLLAQTPMLSARPFGLDGGSLLKWIKLDVLGESSALYSAL